MDQLVNECRDNILSGASAGFARCSGSISVSGWCHHDIITSFR